MNRQKKKVNHSSDEDDQVSIFDSEEEESKQKKSHSKSAHKSHKKAPATSKINNNKPKRITPKSREKKLCKDEDAIMKKLMGVKEEERSRQSTESDKKQQIKFEENQPPLKIEHINPNNDEWKDESNPYEEIPLLEEYPTKKGSDTYGNHTQQYANTSTVYPNTTNFSYKTSNSYQIAQQYPPQQSFGHQYTPQQSYNQAYYNPYNTGVYPNIDPSIELNFDDFQEVNFDDDKITGLGIEMQDIQQLREEVNLEKVESQKDYNKHDKKFRKRRMTYILSQIERLKKQYIQLQNLTADSYEAATSQPLPVDCNLLKEWKYDPSLLKKPEKPQIKIQEKPAEEGQPKSKTEGRITMLNEVLTENPFLTQVEMADVLRAMDPVMNARIERSVVLRLLKMCGFKKKKVRGVCKERNTPLSLSLRCEYAHKYREFVAQKFETFYFDELIINQYFDKESGWCMAEEEVEFRPERFIDRSVVVLAVLSSKGTCKWDAKFGNYQLEDYCKAFNNLLKASEANIQKKLLIVNPLPYRDPKHIIDIVERRGWDMLVLPTDGLGLNPLQSYFTDVRDIMKRKRYDTVENLFQSVVEVLQDGDKQAMSTRMLGRVETYIDKAMRRELL